MLTYAAGLDDSDPKHKHIVKHVVWIAEQFNDEHRIAVNWLNRNTGADVSVFALVAECKTIGSSAKALELTVVAKPNNWGVALPPEQERNKDFWSRINDNLGGGGVINKRPKPGTGKSLFFGTLRTNFRLRGLFNKKQVQVALYVDGPNPAVLVGLLEDDRSDVEDAIGEPLLWDIKGDGSAEVISVQRDGVNPEDPKEWNDLTDWMSSRLELFHKAFDSRVRDLTLPDEASRSNRTPRGS